MKKSYSELSDRGCFMNRKFRKDSNSERYNVVNKCDDTILCRDLPLEDAIREANKIADEHGEWLIDIEMSHM